MTRRRGFTFIEVLATMTFLAIVLPAVMNGISLCLATAHAARCKAEASDLARSKLTELIALQQWQQTQVTGDFGEDFSDYRWTAQAGDYDTALSLRNLTVTVSYLLRGTEHTVALATMVYTGGQQ